VVSASGAVLSARTISHSFITLAGEKKCMPSTSCGRLGHLGDLVDVEIGGVGGQHAPGLAYLSSAVNTSFLIAMVSNTASITRSRP
jgi:hypothetical protein